MNMIKLIDKIKTEIFPLHDHHASDLDRHSRELYATMLASVVLNKGEISEVENRLFSMLLNSLGLDNNAAKYLELAQKINSEKALDFFKSILNNEEMKMVFLIDCLILSRIESPLVDMQLDLMAELFDILNLDINKANNLIGYSQFILGMKEESTFLENIKVATHFDLGFEKDQFYYDNGVWIDKRTKLMWSRFCLGQEWINGKVSGNASKFNFDEANQVVKKLTLTDFEDWRIPTIDELKTLILSDKAGFDCPNGVLFQPKQDEWGYFWSATCHKASAWLANFSKGTLSNDSKNNYRYVRAVRNIVV